MPSLTHPNELLLSCKTPCTCVHTTQTLQCRSELPRRPDSLSPRRFITRSDTRRTTGVPRVRAGCRRGGPTTALRPLMPQPPRHPLAHKLSNSTPTRASRPRPHHRLPPSAMPCLSSAVKLLHRSEVLPAGHLREVRPLAFQARNRKTNKNRKR